MDTIRIRVLLFLFFTFFMLSTFIAFLISDSFILFVRNSLFIYFSLYFLARGYVIYRQVKEEEEKETEEELSDMECDYEEG